MDDKKAFLAGATGALGLSPAALLVQNGDTVTGTTRKRERLLSIRIGCIFRRPPGLRWIKQGEASSG